jgi:hypothetical protein
MKRESVKPWDWGLKFSMDQGEAEFGDCSFPSS